MSPSFNSLRLKRIIGSPYTLAIVLGFAGGGAYAFVGAPLAWLLGAMSFTTVAAFAGLNVAVYMPLRRIMIIVLGVMLGSSFSSELIGRLPGWALAVALLVCALGLLTLAAYVLLRVVGKYDPVTAYFSSTPGGLSEMAIVGEEAGGDVRTISLTHATRILIVVSVIPFYFRFVMGLDVPAQAANAVSIVGFDLMEAGILILCGVIGFPLASFLKLPAPALLGPTAVSALAHITGVSHVPPPAELIAMAQVIIGAAIGARFTGITLSHVWRAALLAAASGLLMIGVAALLAPLGASMISISTAAMFLALAPGGLTEMSLIALSLGVDTAFVSTMHILRIVLIIGFAPLFFHVWSKWRAP